MKENEKLIIDSFFGGLLGYLEEQWHDRRESYDVDQITDLLADYYQGFVKNNTN